MSVRLCSIFLQAIQSGNDNNPCIWRSRTCSKALELFKCPKLPFLQKQNMQGLWPRQPRTRIRCSRQPFNPTHFQGVALSLWYLTNWKNCCHVWLFVSKAKKHTSKCHTHALVFRLQILIIERHSREDHVQQVLSSETAHTKHKSHLKQITLCPNVIAQLVEGLSHRVPLTFLFRIIQNDFLLFQNRLISTSRNSYLREGLPRLVIGQGCPWVQTVLLYRTGNSLQVDMNGSLQKPSTANDSWILAYGYSSTVVCRASSYTILRQIHP